PAGRAAPAASSFDVHENVAVWRNDNVTRAIRSLGKDRGAETLDQLESGGAARRVHARREPVLRGGRSSENTDEEEGLLHEITGRGKPSSGANPAPELPTRELCPIFEPPVLPRRR